jgi:hypothetical protein
MDLYLDDVDGNEDLSVRLRRALNKLVVITPTLGMWHW